MAEPTKSGGMFRSLRFRNARLYFLGLLVSNVGTWIQFTATSYLLYDLRGNATVLGINTALQFLPMLVLGAWAGALSDRVDRLTMTRITQVLQALQALVLAGLVFTDNISVPFYMGMRVIRSKDVPVTGSSPNKKFACYVMASGAVGTGQQAALRTEVDRDILAKSDAMSVDWHNVYHPLGARYTGSANPTTADLATAGNWQKVFETENIGIVRITVTSSFD